MKLISIASIAFFFIFFISTCSGWTWSYRKKINLEEASQLSNKPNVIFSKVDVPIFNQLIFSWNALRPAKGYFSFYVQARHHNTKTWTKWFKMLDWGNGIQKSYTTTPKTDVYYEYVRLEMPKNNLADGFKLKVVPQNNADLSNLRLLGVSISDFSKFGIEKINDLLNLNSVEIKEVPKRSQMALDHAHNKRMCSPTSTSMMLSHLSNVNVDPITFACKVYDNGLDAYGSWPFNTAAAFEICPAYYFRVARLNGFADLHSYLLRGYPVVVSVRGRLTGAPQDYNKGHLILVTGWDKANREVIVHDPAFSNDAHVKMRYDLVSFIRAWERSHRLSYIVERR